MPQVWQCCTCSNQFADWGAFEDHAEHSGHDEATEVDTAHASTGKVSSDPTGTLALELERLADDHDAIQEHWRTICASWHTIVAISRRHKPEPSNAEPACSIESCENPVESRPSERTGSGRRYQGMEQIDGVWIAKPGVRPLCAAHRKQQQRREVA